MNAAAQLFFIHPDHLNTPRLITNQVGQAVWRWDNTDPFGGNVPDENPSGLGTFTCNLRLPGQYFDKETNTHYNLARDYEPAIGRYIQSDPIGLYGGLNTYLHVEGNPLSFIDPEGLTLWDVYANRPRPTSWKNMTAASGRVYGVQKPRSSGNVWGKASQQTPECDVVGGPPFNANQSQCALNCCVKHDECYTRHGCNWSSWINVIFNPRTVCAQCNLDAVECFLRCDDEKVCR